MEFIVRQLAARPDTVLVRYDCACGCKPGAEHQQGSHESDHEHCCCGQVHFVGENARGALDAYLADRSTRGEDEDIGGHDIFETEVAAPWGNAIPVAYGLPRRTSRGSTRGRLPPPAATGACRAVAR